MDSSDSNNKNGHCFKRRSILAGVIAIAAITSARSDEGAADQLDPLEKVKKEARDLVDALILMHGGSWSVNINHQLGFVSVSKDLA